MFIRSSNSLFVQISELNTISCVFMDDSTTDKIRTAVKVGAAVTLSTMEEYFQLLISKVIFNT